MSFSAPVCLSATTITALYTKWASCWWAPSTVIFVISFCPLAVNEPPGCTEIQPSFDPSCATDTYLNCRPLYCSVLYKSFDLLVICWENILILRCAYDTLFLGLPKTIITSLGLIIIQIFRCIFTQVHNIFHQAQL
jgi:hypothetical protein